MSEKYAYFVAAGQSASALDRINAEWLAARDRAVALKDRLDAVAVVCGDNGQGPIMGFTFAGDPPDGWKKCGDIDGEPFFKPGRKSKALRDVGDEIGAASYSPQFDLNRTFAKGPFGIMVGERHPRGGGVIRSVSLETLGDQRVIGIPLVNGELTVEPPADARPLKLSEYYAMKEAAAEQAA